MESPSARKNQKSTWFLYAGISEAYNERLIIIQKFFLYRKFNSQ